MKKMYEATRNVHIPEMKCSFPKGTRFEIEEETVTVNGRTIQLSEDFQILMRCGIFRELSEKEASKPVQVEAPKTLIQKEKKKMKVEYQEDAKIPLHSSRITENPDPEDSQTGKGVHIQPSDSEDLGKEVREVRGMKIVEEASTPIVVATFGDKKEASRSASHVKPKEKTKEEKIAAQKKADALKAERVKKATSASAPKSTSKKVASTSKPKSKKK